MGESGGRLDQQSDAERRILRAREAIGRSFEELINRGEGVAPSPGVEDPPPEDPPREGVVGFGGDEGPGVASTEGYGGPEVEELIVAVEGRVLDRIDRGAGERQAALDARVAAAEAALRSRLSAELEQRSSEQSRRMGEEAAGFRKRINEELAGALQTTAAELRRQLEADREGAKRDISQAAREQIESAVGRLDRLEETAVRDAREAAEEVAASRIAGARSEIAKGFESAHAQSSEGIDRGLSELNARLQEMFTALREEQRSAGSVQQDEARRRSEARIDELSEELSARVEREVRWRLDEAKEELERVNDDSASAIRAEAIAGAEVATQRELAKGEARLAAASVDVDLDRRAAESVEAHASAFREELATTSYREHSRRAEDAAAGQLARALDALKDQRSELVAELASMGAAERDLIEAERTRSETEMGRSLSAAKDQLDRRVAEVLAEAEARLAARGEASVAAGFDARAAGWERRLQGLVDEQGKASRRRFERAATDAERRLASVEHAQQREEAVRTRTRAAERQAEERVREAERRLTDVLAKITSVGRPERRP